MTIDVTMHRVTSVEIIPSEESGTRWLDFVFYNEDGDRIEVTAFHEGNIKVTDSRPPPPLKLGKVDMLKPGCTS